MQRIYWLTRVRQQCPVISARGLIPSRIGRVKIRNLDVRFHSTHSRQMPQADNNSSSPPGGSGTWSKVDPSLVVDIALKTLIGLGVIFIGGNLYVFWYKHSVLSKIEAAFNKTWDDAALVQLIKQELSRFDLLTPDLEHASLQSLAAKLSEVHPRRQEQDFVDSIVKGEMAGSYFLLVGPKGAGKSGMVFDAMLNIRNKGAVFLEAHPDLEVFRLRLGNALNYEFSEDMQAGLFQRPDPRSGGPAMDIERALDKLYEVAMRNGRRRPLVLVITKIQNFQNDDQGRNLLLQIQQYAERWAIRGIVTVVFTTDDVWPYTLLRKAATLMEVRSVQDLDWEMSKRTLLCRRPDAENVNSVVHVVGGRQSYLNKVSRAEEMLQAAEDLLRSEKAWLENCLGLIPDCDNDGEVVVQQKWSLHCWTLLREFVRLYRVNQRESGDSWDPLKLPVIPAWRCQQIMTRPDYLDELDRLDVVYIDMNSNVQPDSMLVLRAALDIVEKEGFDELLEDVRCRIKEIENLRR
ncbi:uncharacterized protein F5891DRAFT_1215387 [Suillus fuscotomentosus]|uniref:AAA protein C-terminal winged helix domain-containing protein n=1 Tax=Suillus fuscotomentosus TaxID=1912939 RepID=A0AAD4HPG5_9AGAM|nr:uncharacterized protein F5891DRAFT_1215387 [Suillus fuscotomentosus]KAG1902729.1 hypothetical protein F5891DRAFT_1215387 [Suillus fuscotomentosus]